MSKQKIVEKIIYRGTTDQSFSKQHGIAFAGLFYGPTAKSVKGWGIPKKFNLLRSARIFEYESSDAFCYDQGFYNKEYKELKQLSKIYGVNVTALNYFTTLSEDQKFTLDKNVQQVAGSLFCWYDLWTWCTQLVARIELEKRGYDGALWKEEDFGNPVQYQIWNLNVIKTIEEENLKNHKMNMNTFRFKLVEDRSLQQLNEGYPSMVDLGRYICTELNVFCGTNLNYDDYILHHLNYEHNEFHPKNLLLLPKVWLNSFNLQSTREFKNPNSSLHSRQKNFEKSEASGKYNEADLDNYKLLLAEYRPIDIYRSIRAGKLIPYSVNNLKRDLNSILDYYKNNN